MDKGKAEGVCVIKKQLVISAVDITTGIADGGFYNTSCLPIVQYCNVQRRANAEKVESEPSAQM